MLLILSSCATNDSDIFEDTSDILADIYEEWGIMIPYQDVSKSKTYNLLEALIDHIDKNQVLLITFPSSSLTYPSVTKFNEHLLNSEEAVAFFKREDCVFVLISTYLSNLKTERGYGDNYYSKFYFLELVLSSEMFMSEMNLSEKVQLMALALERIKYEESYPEPFTIMISIMLSSNYTSFVNDVKPMLLELGMGVGYGLVTNDGCLVPGYDLQANDLLTEYAKKFINDNK